METTYYQAFANINGVDVSGPCFSGEDFAIRAFVKEVAEWLQIPLHEAQAKLNGKIQIRTV